MEDGLLKGHGENSVTFQLFHELNQNKLRNLLSYTGWVPKSPYSNGMKMEEVHLFPCFGKAKGYGEPDAIILTPKKVIYVEVELTALDKRILPEPFIKQMRKFILLANDILGSSRRRIVKKFSGHRDFRGQYKLRSLYAKIKKEKKEPCLLVISHSVRKDVDVGYLEEQLRKQNVSVKNINLGWINYHKIKKMKGLSKTVETINFNLKS